MARIRSNFVGATVCGKVPAAAGIKAAYLRAALPLFLMITYNSWLWYRARVESSLICDIAKRAFRCFAVRACGFHNDAGVLCKVNKCRMASALRWPCRSSLANTTKHAGLPDL